MTSEDQKILTMTAACPEWLGEKLSIPLKDQTGNIIGGVDFGAGESWGVVTVTEPAAAESLTQALNGWDLQSVSMGYRVKEVSPEPWQQRVIDEKAELDIKIKALANFLNVSTRPYLPEEDLEDLVLQYGTMQEYSKILERRISRFPKELKVCAPNP
jgi:hypothetical protein